jgi:hypothetical protein
MNQPIECAFVWRNCKKNWEKSFENFGSRSEKWLLMMKTVMLILIYLLLIMFRSCLSQSKRWLASCGVYVQNWIFTPMHGMHVWTVHEFHSFSLKIQF